MTCRIGRWGDDFDVADPMSWRQDGDRIRISGLFVGASTAVMQAAREQFLGLVLSPWEPVVPCYFSHDTSKSGFYEVGGGSFDLTSEHTYPNNRVPWNLELRRIPNHQAPKTIVTSTGAERSTKDAGVTDDPWSAVPSDAGGTYGLDGTPAAFTTRTGPGHSDSAWNGQAVQWRTAAYYLGATSGGTSEFRVAQDSHYDMSARLTVDGYTVLGDRWNFSGNLTDWVLSNGYIKLTGSASSFCTITGPGSTPTSWGAVNQAMKVGFYASSTFLSMYPGSSAIDVAGMRVDYNDPALVSVTFFGSYSPVSATTIPVSMTVVLRRGSSYAEFYASAPTTRAWAVGFNSTTATTSATGVQHATSNDADGNRVFSCMEAETKDNTEGFQYLSSAAKSGQFCIGVEYGGSSSSGINTVANCRDQYYAAVSETQAVVG